MNQDSLNQGKNQSILVRLKEFFGKIIFKIKNIKKPKNRLDKFDKKTSFQKTNSRNWKLIGVVIAVILLFSFFTTSIVFAIGMYRYGWDGKATRIAMKVLPYPASIVGLDSVSMNEFYEELSYVQHFYKKTGQTPPEESVLKKQILDQLIERNILEHQSQKYNVVVSGQEVDEEFQKIADENGGTEEVSKILTDLYGLSTDGFKKLIRAQLLKEKLRDEVPAQRKTKHLLIKWTKKDGSKKKKEALAKIRRIRKAIVDKKTTFEKIAKKYSEDITTKNKGGDLGWVQRGQMVKEFEEILFKLKKDQISGVVLTKFGYHLIKVDDIKGKVDMSFVDWIENITNNTKTWKLVK